MGGRLSTLTARSGSPGPAVPQSSPGQHDEPLASLRPKAPELDLPAEDTDADTFEAILGRSAGEPWGFSWQVGPYTSRRFLLAGVEAGSPAARWTEQQQDRGLRGLACGDELLEVNRQREPGAMQRELLMAPTVWLLFRRTPEREGAAGAVGPTALPRWSPPGPWPQLVALAPVWHATEWVAVQPAFPHMSSPPPGRMVQPWATHRSSELLQPVALVPHFRPVPLDPAHMGGHSDTEGPAFAAAQDRAFLSRPSRSSSLPPRRLRPEFHPGHVVAHQLGDVLLGRAVLGEPGAGLSRSSSSSWSTAISRSSAAESGGNRPNSTASGCSRSCPSTEWDYPIHPGVGSGHPSARVISAPQLWPSGHVWPGGPPPWASSAPVGHLPGPFEGPRPFEGPWCHSDRSISPREFWPRDERWADDSPTAPWDPCSGLTMSPRSGPTSSTCTGGHRLNADHATCTDSFSCANSSLLAALEDLDEIGSIAETLGQDEVWQAHRRQTRRGGRRARQRPCHIAARMASQLASAETAPSPEHQQVERCPAPPESRGPIVKPEVPPLLLKRETPSSSAPDSGFLPPAARAQSPAVKAPPAEHPTLQWMPSADGSGLEEEQFGSSRRSCSRRGSRGRRKTTNVYRRAVEARADARAAAAAAAARTPPVLEELADSMKPEEVPSSAESVKLTLRKITKSPVLEPSTPAEEPILEPPTAAPVPPVPEPPTSPELDLHHADAPVAVQLQPKVEHERVHKKQETLAEDPVIEVGSSVVVQGLIRMAHFNGQQGKVESFDPVLSRYMVQLTSEGGQPVVAKLRRGNLLLPDASLVQREEATSKAARPPAPKGSLEAKAAELPLPPAPRSGGAAARWKPTLRPFSATS